MTYHFVGHSEKIFFGVEAFAVHRMFPMGGSQTGRDFVWGTKKIIWHSLCIIFG